MAKKADLASLKSDTNKLDIGKLEKVSSDLSGLKSKVKKSDIDKLGTTPVDVSYIVKNDFVKMTELNELIIKVNNITTTDASDL